MSASPPSPDVASALAKARRRLLPFLFLLYVVSYLDRVNVGFAALQMNAAIGLSDVTYSLGAGIFFLSYTLFEVPSNMILARVGARVWIARIMISWGLVSASMMFVHGATAFYILRFALGAAEAGFFPGIIYCLTRWFPSDERARAIAGFMTAVVVAGMIGGPLSGFLLSMGGAGGLAGWQWLFVLEGLPAVVLGVVVFRVLPEQPSDALWLTPAERAALTRRLEEESAGRAVVVRSLGGAVASGRVWLLAAAYFTIPVALYAMGFWLPQIIKASSGGSDALTGVLTAIPYGVAAIGMVVVGRHSDRTGERRWHIAVSGLVGGAAFARVGVRERHRAIARDAVAGDARPGVHARAVLDAGNVHHERRRRRRRHRARELGGQRRRVRRPEHHRVRPRSDAQLRGRPRGGRGHPRRRRPARPALAVNPPRKPSV